MVRPWVCSVCMRVLLGITALSKKKLLVSMQGLECLSSKAMLAQVSKGVP